MAKWKRSFYLRWIEPLLEDNGAVNDGLKRWDVSFYCDTFYLLFRLVENPEVQLRGEDRRLERGVHRSLLTLSLSLSLPSVTPVCVCACVCVCVCVQPLSLFSVYFLLTAWKQQPKSWAAPHLHLLSLGWWDDLDMAVLGSDYHDAYTHTSPCNKIKRWY